MNLVQGEVYESTDRRFKMELELSWRVRSEGIEEEKTKPLDLLTKRRRNKRNLFCSKEPLPGRRKRIT